MSERLGYNPEEFEEKKKDDKPKEITRREFLKGLIATGAAAFIGGSLAARKNEIKPSNIEQKPAKNPEIKKNDEWEQKAQGIVELEKAIVLRNHYFPTLKSECEDIDEKYSLFVKETALKHDLDSQMIKALIFLESNGKNTKRAYVGTNPQTKERIEAVGVCQFLPDTAREYGLKVGNGVDERLNPEKSIEAAARFIKKHIELLGSYDLAIETYHLGYGNMYDLIKQYCKDSGLIFTDPPCEAVKKYKINYRKIFFDNNSSEKNGTYNELFVQLGGDNAPYYYFKMRAIAQIMKELKTNPKAIEKYADKCKNDRDVLIKDIKEVLRKNNLDDKQMKKFKISERIMVK